MTLRLIALTTMLCLPTLRELRGQDAGPRGVRPPAALVPTTMKDTTLVTLFNSVEVLGHAFVGAPARELRVLATWGEPARLDSDELTERVYVAVNEDGSDLSLFRVGDLLRPKVECIVPEGGAPVAYLSYGLQNSRYHARIEARPARLLVTEVRASAC
jgi:hypothetical protein